MPSPLLGYNTNVRHHGKLFHIQTEDSGVTHGHIFTHLFADGGRIIATRKSSYAEWIGTDRYPAIVKKLMQAQHKAMFIALRDGLFDEDEIAGAKAFLARPITLDDERGGPGLATPPSGTTPLSPSGLSASGAAGSRPDLDADALDRAAAAYLSKAPSFAGDEVGEATIPGAVSPEPIAPRPPSASPSRARLDPTPVATPIQAPRPAAPRAPSGTFSAASPARPASTQGVPAQAAPPPKGAPAPAASRATPAQPTGAVRAPGAPSPGRYQQTQPAASRPKAASVKPSAEPSLFGADILSEKSLDEVIMSYLAEDLDEKD